MVEKHPNTSLEELQKKVTSPGGVTSAGMVEKTSVEMPLARMLCRTPTSRRRSAAVALLATFQCFRACYIRKIEEKCLRDARLKHKVSA